jgi:histidinol-phosphatase (PHP family)
MSWVNYHSHTLFCDGKAEPEAYLKHALLNNFAAWGFSAHAPVPFPSVWNMPANQLDAYLAEIHRLKMAYNGRMEVYAGLETDFIPEISVDNLPDRSRFDYIIGSVHYMGRWPDGSHFCFDGQPEMFFSGIESLYKNNFREAITAYFRLMMRMVKEIKPDIVGHLDKIKMHNSFQPYLDEKAAWYVKLVEETLDLIRHTGSILEVNTRGLYKHNPSIFYPGEWIVERALQKKIPLVINSDAHHPDDLLSGFPAALQLLGQMGCKTLRVLLGGRWQDVPFTHEGLLI